jgi:hypothetical protein
MWLLVVWLCMGIIMCGTEGIPSRLQLKRRGLVSQELDEEDIDSLEKSEELLSLIDATDATMKLEHRNTENTPSLLDEGENQEPLVEEDTLLDNELSKSSATIVHNNQSTLPSSREAIEAEMRRYIRQNFAVSKNIVKNIRAFIPELNEQAEEKVPHPTQQPLYESKPARSPLQKRDVVSFDSLSHTDLFTQGQPAVTVNIQHIPGRQLMARSLDRNMAAAAMPGRI